ncbi:MAG: MipA/OmpV family protein [Verrucomicrobia bacterium]|nr:MipA/OmpV family protein [Verrucomicrobiota bacterium]
MKRNTVRMISAAAFLVVAMAAGGWAAEAGLDLVVNSHYVWRGQVLNDEPVFQPSVTVSKGGFSFNWWGNLNLTDKITGDAFEFSEHDVGISYARPCPLTGAEVTLGLVNYDFPNTAVDPNAVGAEALTENTHEVYLSYSLTEVPLAPTLLVSYDFNEVEDFYANLAVSHSFDLAEKLTLDLGASLGFGGKDYNDFYFSFEPEEGEAIVNDSAALNDANVSVGLTYAFSETLSLGGALQYAALLDSDIEKGAEAIYGEKDVVYGGVTLSQSF